MSSVPWYLLRAATRQEKRACESLKELKVEHYLPTETVRRTLNRREVDHGRALFPGYLFARIVDDMFHAAVSAAGVSGPVRKTLGTGERVPCIVAPGLVEAIMSAEAQGAFDRRPPPPRPLGTGDSVLVLDGPFAAKIGAIVEMRAKDRIALLIGGLVVEVAATEVQAAA